MTRTEKENLVPVWERITISLEEAAAYSGIGVRKLRDMTDKPECNYVIWVGNRRMIKRKKFDEYLESAYSYISSWREADREQWNQARWFNGMDAAQTADENKTIVCGHWHTSYGHSKYEHKGTEFGEDADFSPYYGPGIIAIDACTAFSGKSNCLVIED